ncbi:ribonuclease [Oceanobacillus luteolus]|uniref:ribonuclease domain-containing protein n=1 Tax=Oceanobacillus luteolus TaxID=1274358 RepID=UPI00203B6E4E|nr:ribonuclease domain-containing protein [Oceanobacillus luteolus]MCM3740961.1 ribonuclease [Oceanobacillus luteolus]
MPKKIIYLFFLTLLSILLAGCSPTELLDVLQDEDLTVITEDGHYTSKEEVALYIHTYNKLPPNYITKREASELGWEASEGNLWEVTDKKSIGGDKFYNREGKLPKKEGRQYYEADINYEGGYRGPERIVYSNDGLIYYTDDHYETFTLLYGDE